MRSAIPKIPSFRDAVVDWIGGQDWTFFATLTTPYQMSLRSARRLAERTHRSWDRMANGHCTMLWVAEKNELRDGHHLHALVRVPDEFHAPHLHKAMCEAYQVQAGGTVDTIDRTTGAVKFTKWSRIDLQRFDRRRNAAGYLAKYMTKGNELLDWDVY